MPLTNIRFYPRFPAQNLQKQNDAKPVTFVTAGQRARQMSGHPVMISEISGAIFCGFAEISKAGFSCDIASPAWARLEA